MDAQTFLKSATDPKAWFDRSRALRRSGQALLDTAIQFRIDSSEIYAQHTINAHMLLGYSLEAAFKGQLLMQKPGEVEVKVIFDGKGEMRSAELSEMGNKTHDLVSLAKSINVLNKASDKIDFAVLLYLSTIIKWGARYPVPLSTNANMDLPGEFFSDPRGIHSLAYAIETLQNILDSPTKTNEANPL